MKTRLALLLVVCLLVSFVGCAPQTPDATQAHAYLAVLEAFWYEESITVVDLSETNISDKEAVYALMEDYCRQRNARFMRYDDYAADDNNGLVAETVLLSFRDSRLTKTRLVTEVSQGWPYYYAGCGTHVVVKYQNGTWVVKNMETTWMS